ncbi:flagellar protein FliT [Halomonas sp. M20]|uniref:flagellar protein FliT n=1 Tax=Halomonas sp. M20 TaxID=2763264 RepID=UPI001D0B704B|nr:flagellar protein FliT [Halomonas sp. M20]
MRPIDAVFVSYKKLLTRSARMLALARKEEWAQLAEEESAYRKEIEALKELETPETQTSDSVRRKAELLERLLIQDAETRRCVEKHRAELGELMDDSRRRRDLSRAYQAADIGGVSSNQGRQ